MSEHEQEQASISWISSPSESDTLHVCKKAFMILCPNVQFPSMESIFRVEWTKGEMDPVVFDKFIFPDFLFINKNDLEF
jgi:hypothetical protein